MLLSGVVTIFTGAINRNKSIKHSKWENFIPLWMHAYSLACDIIFSRRSDFCWTFCYFYMTFARIAIHVLKLGLGCQTLPVFYRELQCAQ